MVAGAGAACKQIPVERLARRALTRAIRSAGLEVTTVVAGVLDWATAPSRAAAGDSARRN